MKRAVTFDAAVPGFNGAARAVIWERGDPFPGFGESCGVDTETHLITDCKLEPELVVLGVWNPKDATAYISYWEDAVVFVRELCRREIQQRYFNLGFDFFVLSNEDPEWPLVNAVEQGRVRDMQIRIHLHEIATQGFIRGNLWSLEGCTLQFCNVQLDKGEEEGDAAPRKTFRRGVEITDEQMVYLGWDCLSTWSLGEAVPAEKTEVTHTKGMVALYKIRSNGFLVDPKVFDAMEAKLLDARQEARQRLLSYGFPDPDRDSVKEYLIERTNFCTQYEELLRRCGLVSELPMEEVEVSEDEVVQLQVVPKKCNLRQMLVYLYNYKTYEEPAEIIAQVLKASAEKPRTSLTKPISAVYAELVAKYELHAFDAGRRKIVMMALTGRVLEKYNEGASLDDAFEYACSYMDEHPEWLSGEEPIGPRKFFQEHVKHVVEQNPKLELEMTPKSGEYKLTKKDQWRLQDLDIQDKFLEAYIDFGHTQKYLSTYLNREHICSDGRMRGKFTNILRTGRTSCSAPNLQNYPSRDKEYPLRNIFMPPEGFVLCATDFSFIELCAFAQSCLTRFGKSRMADIINAGLDPHRWFAAVKAHRITTKLDFIKDPKACHEFNEHLKEIVSKTERQNAKAANFGFPGALGVKTFWRNCREQGIQMTIEEAAEARKAWIDAFPEMKYHMKPEEIKEDAKTLAKYGGDIDEDEIEIEGSESSRQRYKATTITGFRRYNCSYNSACNIHFQSVVAEGAKEAMWNLLSNGFADRMVNFVHDEVLYLLRIAELCERIPIVEQLMIAGMKKVIPDVKVGVESSVMRHWDKGAVEFDKLKWEDGRPIIEEPAFVKGLYAQVS